MCAWGRLGQTHFHNGRKEKMVERGESRNSAGGKARKSLSFWLFPSSSPCYRPGSFSLYKHALRPLALHPLMPSDASTCDSHRYADPPYFCRAIACFDSPAVRSVGLFTRPARYQCQQVCLRLSSSFPFSNQLGYCWAKLNRQEETPFRPFVPSEKDIIAKVTYRSTIGKSTIYTNSQIRELIRQSARVQQR